LPYWGQSSTFERLNNGYVSPPTDRRFTHLGAPPLDAFYCPDLGLHGRIG